MRGPKIKDVTDRHRTGKNYDSKGDAKTALCYPTSDSDRNESKKMPAGMSLDALLFKPRNIPSTKSLASLSKFQIAKNQQHEAEEYLKKVEDVEIDDPIVKEAVDVAMGIATHQMHKFHISQVSFAYEHGFKTKLSSDGQDIQVYTGSLDCPRVHIAKKLVKSEKDVKREKMDQNEKDLIREMVNEMSRASRINANFIQKQPRLEVKSVEDDSGSDIFETDGIDYVAEIKEKKIDSSGKGIDFEKTNFKPAPINLFQDEKLEDLKVELPSNFDGGRNLQQLIQNSHKIKVNRDSHVDDGMEMEALVNIDDADGLNYDYDNFYDSDSDSDGKRSRDVERVNSGGVESSRLNQDFQRLDSHFEKKYGSGLRDDKKASGFAVSSTPKSSGKEKRKAEGGSKKLAKRIK